MSRTERVQDRRMQKFRTVLCSWEAGRLSQLEAAQLLGCSERHFRRLRGRFDEEGEAGLADKRIGNPSAKAIGAGERTAMLERYRQSHRGWTAKHFHDYGKRHHGFRWGYSWTKTQLHAAGLIDRAPRRGAHRRKRERKPYEGMMLHQDGTPYQWLAGQGELDLIVTMDDATSTVYSAVLVEEEGTASTFRALIEVFGEHGLPSSLYTDRGSHYFHTPVAGGPVDKSLKTQVGRALDRLGVGHIAAYSPQARGRSERMNGTLQQRLARELELARITSIEAANRWIKTEFLPGHNRQFAKPAAEPALAFVAVDRSVLIETLAREEERIVARDNTVSWGRLRLQIPQQPGRAHYVKARVKVREYPDGSLAIFHGPRAIARFDASGGAAGTDPAAPSLAAYSAASRSGLEAPPSVARPRKRPSLTRPARAASGLPSRNELEGAT